MAVTRDAVRTARRESPAHRRILDTAGRLFYAEGIRAVGIDRIIAEAGVAKATFYSHFPAKDDLVRAYLAEESRTQRAAVHQARTADRGPLETLLLVFDAIGELGCGPDFHGCAFVNAAVEYPDAAHPVRQLIADHRAWFRGVLRELLEAAAHPEPDRGAAMLMLLRDGVVVSSRLDDAAEVRSLVRTAVTRLLGPIA